jgi:hypothetical protein
VSSRRVEDALNVPGGIGMSIAGLTTDAAEHPTGDEGAARARCGGRDSELPQLSDSPVAFRTVQRRHCTRPAPCPLLLRCGKAGGAGMAGHRFWSAHGVHRAASPPQPERSARRTPARRGISDDDAHGRPLHRRRFGRGLRSVA